MTPEKRAYKRDVIIEVTTNLMFPLTLLFGLYVMFGTGGTGEDSRAEQYLQPLLSFI